MRSSSLAKTMRWSYSENIHWDLTNNHWVFVAHQDGLPPRFDGTHPVWVYAQHWLFSLLVNSLFFFMIKYPSRPPFLSCHRNHMLTMVAYHEIMGCLPNHKLKNHHLHGVFSPSPKMIWDYLVNPTRISKWDIHTWFILKSITLVEPTTLVEPPMSWYIPLFHHIPINIP